MSMTDYSADFQPPPADVMGVASRIADFLQGEVADKGTGIDSGGGFGQRDLWVKVGGIEYLITVRLTAAEAMRRAPGGTA